MSQKHVRSATRRRVRTMLIAMVGAFVMALVLALMMGLSYETSTRFAQIQRGWQEYSEDADPRGIWISEIRGYFGYGGMIHNFKNYVLRHDELYADALRRQTELLLIAIDAYQDADPGQLEQNALQRIRSVVEEYSQNVEKISRGIEQGLSAEQIDTIVRVDDREALEALLTLENHWRDQRQHNLDNIVRALNSGDILVQYLTGAMVLLTLLIMLIALLFSILAGRALRAKSALIYELRARKSAQEEERKLAWVVEQSPASILITDTKGRIEFVNRKLLELTGYAKSELIGRSPNIFKSGHTPEATYEEIWKRLRAGRPWSGVFKNLRKDGSHYWASTNLLPLLDENGDITNYIGVGEDITKKRQVDEQIAQIQKMEAVGILAGSVAHDFNNVLMSIIGNVELVRLDMEEFAVSEDITTSLNHIELASRRARALIRQLLTFARQQPGHAQRLELKAAINEVLELVRATTPPTIRMDIATTHEALATDIDPTAFFQIIMNLCHNAIEAMGDDGGILSVQLEALDRAAGSALPRALSEEAIGLIRITIRDDGPGIPPEIQGKVFEPFFSTKPPGKGTGLGLAIVRNWMEECSGSVDMKSTPGKGTTFTLTFPRYEAHENEKSAPNQLTRGNEHILLVDDDQALLYTIRRMMARLGYQVEAFSDPKLALSAFRANPDAFDLVATDMMMPEMSGDELIIAIRDIRPETPVMVISSYHTEDRLPPDLVTDFVPVRKVSKPVDMVGLAQALRETLD